MTTLGVFRGAFRETYRNVPLVTTLYGMNLLFASVIAMAFRGFVASPANAGALGPLLKDFDMTLFYDFLRTRGEAIGALWQVVLFMTLLSVALNAVSSGGVLAALGSGAPFSLRAFFAGCGTFAFRFLRLLVLTGIITGLAGMALIAGAGPVLGALSRNNTSEIPLIEGTAAAALALIVLLILVVMASDYARVLTVRSDSRSMVRTLGWSFAFLGRNAWGAIALHVMVASLTVCLFALYLLLSGLLEMNSGPKVILVFIVQQAFVWCRSFLRVMLFSCELAFTRMRLAVPGTAEIEAA
ncbi:MAG TPA: hypothetical protein VF514_00595 [Bacteroidota bacterium]